jgi:hypothetical protein
MVSAEASKDARRRLHVPERLAAGQPVVDAARADELDQRRAQLVAHGPDLLVGNGIDACPACRIGGVAPTDGHEHGRGAFGGVEEAVVLRGVLAAEEVSADGRHQAREGQIRGILSPVGISSPTRDRR